MKKNRFIPFLIVILSITLLIVVYKFVFNPEGKINAGTFRVNDVVIKSVVDVVEIESQDAPKSISDIKFNTSQNNEITLLIAKENEAKSIYIDNIKVKSSSSDGEIKVSEGSKELISLNQSDKINIYPIEENGQYLIKLNINNVDFLKNANVPSNSEAVTFDGTMLKLMNIKISDIKLEVKFNLNVVENTGKINICKFNFNIPEEDLITNGISVTRKDAANYKFYIK